MGKAPWLEPVACVWDSPVMTYRAVRLACNSLQPQERKPSDASSSHQPAQPLPVPVTQPLCEPHSIQSVPFGNIFFPFSLSMETQNSNNNNKKKNPPSLPTKPCLGRGEYWSPCRNQEEGVTGVSGLQESLNRLEIASWIFACI